MRYIITLVADEMTVTDTTTGKEYKSWDKSMQNHVLWMSGGRQTAATALAKNGKYDTDDKRMEEFFKTA